MNTHNDQEKENLEEIFQELKHKVCYEHNEDSKSPYYQQWVTSSTKGAVDIFATLSQFNIIFDLCFRSVSESFALDWSKRYLEKYELNCDKFEIYHDEKDWFSVIATLDGTKLLEKYK